MEKQVQVFDGHNDTLLKLEIAARRGKSVNFTNRLEGIDIDLVKAREGGFAGGFFAMFTPSRMHNLHHKYDHNDPRNFMPVNQNKALDFTIAMFAHLRRLERDMQNELTICADVNEVRQAISEERIAVVPHIEGAECIDLDFNSLEILHAAGLRSLGLVWSRPNAFGYGAPMVYQPEISIGKGLTSAGRELVTKCNNLGIMIDLSHLTEAGFWDVAKTTSRPLIATHSNVHALSPSARNLTDRQLRAIAESKGVVGLNFHVGFLNELCDETADASLDQMIKHLDYLIDILGENGVALGSDFDGCILPSQIGDVSGLPKLISAMRSRGFGNALINNICQNNWLDVMERSLIGHN
jgi:membrane dipeptidase